MNSGQLIIFSRNSETILKYQKLKILTHHFYVLYRAIFMIWKVGGFLNLHFAFPHF